MKKECKICLNAMVGNEERVILRMLESSYKYIDYWVVQCNGSDKTQSIIEEFYKSKIILNISDIYDIKNKKDQILELSNMGEKKFTNLVKKKIIEIGYKKKLSDLVFLQAKNAKKAGCFGVICSGHESLKIYKKFKINTITPGIRLPGSKLNEQKRVSTPLNAFINSKAYGIVIGRSITGNIKKNINKLLTHLGE